LSSSTEKKQRFQFIDQFRGLVGILMLLGHSSYYFNSIWKQLDPFDPLFASWEQFALRYLGYLCAPGFLMMNGAMVWWAYQRRISKGTQDWSARWHLIQRGLFLIIVQMIWVNSSWGGFSQFKPWHLGIIATIGISMILLTLIINTRWEVRLFIAIAIFFVYPFMLNISYDPENILSKVFMQTFIDAGEFNKYPVLPWFALAILGSVMANGWLQGWKTDKKRIYMSLGIAAAAILLAIIVRMDRGYGNIFPFSDFGTYSFFLDQKYPPSLFHNLWFFGIVVLGVTGAIAIGKVTPKILEVFTIVGKVPLFFYCVHIGILGIFAKRIGIYYREGDVISSLIGLAIMLIIMLPLSKWFAAVKRKSKNYFIRLI
jgi:uncharacterized membrane protein